MCIFYFATAQNINTSPAANITSKFTPSEKNRILDNILLDYSFELTNFTQFDGILRTNNYIDIKKYNLAQITLYFDQL